MSAAEHVRQWLHRAQTGCSFAARIARSPRGLTIATFDAMAMPTQLDALFEYAAGEHRPAIGVLPTVRTEGELATQILALAGGERWRVRRVPVPTSLTTDDVFVSIEWRTADAALWSSPMGLGPFATMPATRRAPYCVIAAWTGGHENTFRRRRDPVVHFLDVDLSPYRLRASQYNEMTRASRTATSQLLFDDNANNYRNVAFRLSVAVAERLSVLPLAT